MSHPARDPEAPASPTFTAFAGDRRIGQGDLAQVARAAHGYADASPLVFDDATGRVVDLDLRGSVEEVEARVSVAGDTPKPTRGRPKLGVTAREVTLLPRHWEWLAAQPGGASAALRRLVDQARRETVAAETARVAQEAAYRVMTTLAGNLAGYEEAVRALFANDRAHLTSLISDWPSDIADYVDELASNLGEPQ